ncbi:MAG: protein-export chaperone SecB [Candidatus Binataceae bacterium]
MSEPDAPQPSEPQYHEGLPAQPIRILGQFIKDFSFEAPHAPDIFATLRTESPEIPITIDTNVRHIGGQTFEVSLSVQIEAVVNGGKKAFILELVYSAVAEINERLVPQEHVHPILMIEVPRQMFPFVRQLVSEITGNGGFPPLMLQVFDFADMYRKKFGNPGEAAPTPAADAAPSIH